MTLKEWDSMYCYNPCYHNVGDEVVAYPCSTPTQEWGFWKLSDYIVSTVVGGTIWLVSRDLAKGRDYDD